MARNHTRLAAIGLAGVLTAGALATSLSPALAQTATETPGETQEQTKAERHEERRAAYAAALAEELDLPVERVRAAIDKVDEQMRAEAKARHLAELKTRLDAAVADGKLTQEQADAIYAAAESGAMPFRGGRGHGRGHHGGPRGDAQGSDSETAPASA